MDLTDFGAICPSCDRRYDKPHPRGAEIRICPPCFTREKEPISRKNGGGVAERYDRRFARIKQVEAPQ